MKRGKGTARAKITGDGHGVVSHAGVGLSREMAESTGLVDGVSAALIDTYKGVPIHAPGRVFSDLAVAIADGADAISAAPDLGAELCIDFDATITIAHSEKQNAAKTWKKTFGFHPLLAFLDRPEIAGGEALAGLLRTGNAGSNTAADHITVLEQALASLPEAVRPESAPGLGSSG